jgi:CspA family cold shock protein
MLLFGATLRWRINQTGQTSYQMGKGRDRGPRRRGFEDDSYSPPPSAHDRPQQSFRRAPRENSAPSGPAVDAVVKWFNPDKGFGFVELADGSGDAFLHIAVLQAAGHDAVDPETKLSVQVGQGQKGRQVTAVLTVDATGGGGGGAPRAPARPSPRGSSGGRERPDPATAVEVEGTVKWFNPEKGFGFVVCEDGGKDVFVHVSVVERAGLRGLDEGQRLAMKVVKTQKGREATSLTVLD